MEISLEHAIEVFARLQPAQQVSTLSPDYVLIDAQRSPELAPLFWLYEEKEAFFYQGVHRAPIAGTPYFDLQTPYQYGGPLCNTHDTGFLQRAWNAYTHWCKENAIAAEFMRFHPLLQNEDFYGGEVLFNRLTVWVDLTVSDLLASYETRVRTAVRKAVKNNVKVTWHEGPEMAGWFTGFYHAAMRSIGAEPSYFFPESYVFKILDWRQSRLAICTYEDEPVAAAIFLFSPEVMEYHLSASNAVGKSLGSTNLLLHEAAMLGKADGCKKLYLGGGTDQASDNSLLRFKSGFSHHRAEFKIGKHVHSEAAYRVLKEQFSVQYQAHPTRMLFYR